MRYFETQNRDKHCDLNPEVFRILIDFKICSRKNLSLRRTSLMGINKHFPAFSGGVWRACGREWGGGRGVEQV